MLSDTAASPTTPQHHHNQHHHNQHRHTTNRTNITTTSIATPPTTPTPTTNRTNITTTSIATPPTTPPTWSTQHPTQGAGRAGPRAGRGTCQKAAWHPTQGTGRAGPRAGCGTCQKATRSKTPYLISRHQDTKTPRQPRHQGARHQDTKTPRHQDIRHHYKIESASHVTNQDSSLVEQKTRSDRFNIIVSG